MTLFGKSTVVVNKTTGQMVILIPAKMARDSQFGFKDGDKVLVTYLHKKNTPVIVVHRQRKQDIEITKKETT